MKIDSHQHFWRYTPEQYPWIGPHMVPLKRDFLPVDLMPLLHAVGFDGSILVQARQSLDETAWLLDVADQYDFIMAVVGWVDLQSPDVQKQLERFMGRPKLRGVRHIVEDEADDRFMLHPDFMRGIGLLAEFDLVYDLLICERQLPAAIHLARQFPNQLFVLDHMAKPRIKERYIRPWADNIRRLAGFSNVACKVSGMVTEADWSSWQAGDFTVYLDIVFEAFGPRRVMIGSDWPVCTVAGSYSQVIGIVIDYVKQMSPTEQDWVLGKTAATWYRLS